MEYRSCRHRVLVAAITALIQMAYFARLAFGAKTHDTLRAATGTNTIQAGRPANLFELFYVTFFSIRPLESTEKRGAVAEWFRFAPGRSAGLLLHD